MREIRPVETPDGKWVVEYWAPFNDTFSARTANGETLPDALRALADGLDAERKMLDRAP